MKKKGIFLVLTLLFVTTFSQNLVGSWEAEYSTPEGVSVKNVVIFSNNYLHSDDEFKSQLAFVDNLENVHQTCRKIQANLTPMIMRLKNLTKMEG